MSECIETGRLVHHDQIHEVRLTAKALDEIEAVDCSEEWSMERNRS